VEEVLEVGVGEESSEERSIISVCGRAEEADADDEVEHHRVGAEGARGLLEHGLLEGLITNDHLDGGNGILIEL
jgi:hypothetical protein